MCLISFYLFTDCLSSIGFHAFLLYFIASDLAGSFARHDQRLKIRVLTIPDVKSTLADALDLTSSSAFSCQCWPTVNVSVPLATETNRIGC